MVSNEHRRRYNAENSATILPKRRAYWAANREKLNAQRGVVNAEAHRERQRRYQQSPEVKARRADRQAARRARASAELSRQIVWERDEGICGLCSAPADYATFHVDHIVPLARGGEHTYENVQVAHPVCNLSKGARHNR